MGTLDIGAATRAQQADECKVGNCGRVWHVGFFFDGVGRISVQDAPDNRLSNIVRLFGPTRMKRLIRILFAIINSTSPVWERLMKKND
ncbi:hypothetical protein ACVXG8_18935 [Escherichia coli]